MSRIAGLLTEKNPGQGVQLLDRMVDSMTAGVPGPVQAARQGGVALAWSGHSLGGSHFAPDLALVIDGCIYNIEELRQKDSAEKSDAEILADLYLKKGMEAALKMASGDFAVALYDFRDRTLWLARDRLGLKPLYYHKGKELFAFASRPAALLSLPGIEARPDPRFVALFAASHYRTFDNDPEKSPYAGIAQLPAAGLLRLKDGEVRISRYWGLAELADHDESEEELALRYRELLSDAVKIRLRRTKKPAFTLSGGMDSSSVLSSAVRLTNRKQAAFSSVYADKTYDESEEIKGMLDAAVDPWRAVRVDNPDLFKLVGEMVALHDEPVATVTWLAHYLLCREVKARGFAALFGGLGGDELNAGEYEYYFFHFADLRRAGKESELDNEVRQWAAYHDHPIYRKNFSVMEEGLRLMVDLAVPGRCLPDPRRLGRYLRALNPDYYDLAGFVPVMEHPFASYLKNRAYQDLTRETTPCCLRAEERQTAAFGLGNFLPFLDHRLVEFMFRIPGRLKIQNGVTKHLLRQAMKGVLPEATRTRIKKTGWNAPAHLWFADAAREPLLDMIRSRPFREREIYNLGEVERLVEEHYDIVASGRREENHMMFLWQLVNLETWLGSLSGGR